MPTLTIQLPGLPPVDHILRDEMITIGRMKGNTIALDDASVSVSHAKITRKGADFFLKDLNSTNGTMLNGQTINEARLRDGDQLKFGEVVAAYSAEPEFVATTPSQSTAATLSNPPAPAPQPISTSTSFVSKRLVTQAAQMAQTPVNPPTVAAANSIKRPQKKSPVWVMPALAVGAVVVVVGLILGKFLMGSESKKTTPASNTPTATAPGKNSTPQPAPNNAAAKPAPKSPEPAADARNDVASLKRALQSKDTADRRRAAAALHSLGAGAKDALPELRRALDDPDADVRMWSALALVNNKVYDKTEVPILLQVLHHDNSMLRQVSCLSLALIPYDDAEKDTVVTALTDSANKDEDDDVRKAAVSALKIIAPDSVNAGK